MKRPIITLTTDFGLGSYVAQMKGVLLSYCRDLVIIDITHDVQAQDVELGARILEDTYRAFPDDTLHIAVIDPGVGTRRPILFCENTHGRFIAPDNGLLTMVDLDSTFGTIIRIENSSLWAKDVSPTFHGRDIICHVAGQIAAGLPSDAIGPKATQMVRIPIAMPHYSDTKIIGKIIQIDRFGNLITDVARHQIEEWAHSAHRKTKAGSSEKSKLSDLTVSIGEKNLNLSLASQLTYASEPIGTMLALFDSQGRLEISVNQGDASAVLDAKRGQEVVIQ